VCPDVPYVAGGLQDSVSGICAIWRRDSHRLQESLDCLADGLTLHASERALGLTDLSAGVAVAARFPTQQFYQDSRVLIACDAELYNSDELEQSAGGAGDVPEFAGTAALLARLYERFGCDFVERLRGGFSLVLWDRRERRLLAAIDGFGIKRLVYYQDSNGLLVVSRINAIARCSEANLEINPRAIVNVLNYTADLAPTTIFSKVHRLVPGTLLICSNGELRFSRYWDMRYDMRTGSDEHALAQKLNSIVEQSVAVHAKGAPGTVGAFLSGGTDSSTVVGMMERAGKGPVKAFSIGFQEQQFNELEYAEIAAKKFHADHYTYLVGPDDCFDALPQIIHSFDEPYANSSAIPTYFCARLAAQNGVQALLGGDGGDELFGGNERYLTDKIFETYQKVPRFARKGLIEPLLSLVPFKTGLAGRARRYIHRSNLSPIDRYFSFAFLRVHSPADVFEKDFLSTLGDYSVLDIPSDHYQRTSADHHLDRLLYVDMKITLADNDLPKVTCMSELAGIQTRFPFLDRTVAEFSSSIPAGLKVKGVQKRYLFKKAFQDLLPAEIINKKKHGFGIPVSTWMKSHPPMRELARDTLFSRRAFERGYIRRDFIEDLFRKFEADDSAYYGDTLWGFLALELWHRQVVDEPARIPA